MLPISLATPTLTPITSPPNSGPTSSPTPLPSIPEFQSWTLLFLFSIILATAISFDYLQKTQEQEGRILGLYVDRSVCNKWRAGEASEF